MISENNISGICPLCNRVLIDGDSINEHHLLPKSLKGKEKIPVHKICHQKIHSLFTERGLFNYYHTIERLKEHPEIRKFIKWVQKQDPEFYSRSKTCKEKTEKNK